MDTLATPTSHTVDARPAGLVVGSTITVALGAARVIEGTVTFVHEVGCTVALADGSREHLGWQGPAAYPRTWQVRG